MATFNPEKQMVKPFQGAEISQQYSTYAHRIVFNCPENTPIRAPFDGFILEQKEAGADLNRYPNIGGYIVFFSPKTQVKVVMGYMKGFLREAGREVTRKDVIGFAGKTGDAYTPGVYFESRCLNTEDTFEPVFYETV